MALDGVAAAIDIGPDLVARVEAGMLPGTWGRSFFAFCERNRRFVLWSTRALEELERLMAGVSAGPWIELCAGDGALSAALRRRGTLITATDLHPATDVELLDVRYQAPGADRAAALCVCPPDDRAVLVAIQRLSNRMPVILVTVALDGRVTGASLIEAATDRIRGLPSLEAELITRHDFCMRIGDPRSIRRHGRAFLAVPAAGGS